MKRFPFMLMAVASLLGATGFVFEAKEPVGALKDGAFRVATGQIVRPAGNVLTFTGRPVDMVLSPDGKTLYAKDQRGLVVINTATWKIGQELGFPKDGGSSLHGITVSKDGTTVFASGSGNTVWEFAITSDGKATVKRGLTIPGPEGKGASYPCGVALSPDKKTLYVCLSRNNSLAIVDLTGGTVSKEISVGLAPFDVVLSPDNKTAYVSDWGGRRAKDGEAVANSTGTPVPVDERGVASTGAVSVVDLTTETETAQIAVGLHPSDLELTRDGKTLFVANANSDTVSVIDTTQKTVTETLIIKPEGRLPFGSMPNALTLSPDEKTLYVACGGNNAVAEIPTQKPATLANSQSDFAVRGFIPAGWYPGAIIADSQSLYIANIKGNGSRQANPKTTKEGWNVYQYQGTFQRVPFPNAQTLTKYTAQVKADAKVAAALQTQKASRNNKAPVPVPENVGEPSVFQHIVYIIKENRTYDQVFGDMKQGDGDPNLCLYGRDITPNHHALAEQYVLLDNFYCNGVLSADGHSWVTEGNVTDHLEKAFGGFTRSYTFGDDPLTYSSSGFLWDNVVASGKTFRNYGEMDYTNETPDVSYSAILKDWQEKTGKITFAHNIGVARLKQHTVPDSIGWNMDIPDVMRADIFLRDLKQYEANNNLPNLTIIYLPNDHTTGTTPGDPTPNAYMADNDLALGRIVEGLSKSKFWPKTCVFVVEDDPQAGFDHVDGHRSPCLVVSPYTRRGVVISQFYNQTSVLHTMRRMLGLAPMNQMDALSPLMTACFQNKSQLQTYTALKPKVPLGELNPKKSAIRDPKQRRFAEISERLNFKKVDAANEDTLNRILWHEAKGVNTPYPADVAGAHGKGLTARGLHFGPTTDPDDK